MEQQPMRTNSYLSIRDHWALKYISKCPDQVVRNGLEAKWFDISLNRLPTFQSPVDRLHFAKQREVSHDTYNLVFQCMVTLKRSGGAVCVKIQR
ncbi:hypothetical protein TNCV_2516091 [Trichonephila clavipes]|nr:hypothetical protein TNCV_2516091 [Trichonephila clavipes]